MGQNDDHIGQEDEDPFRTLVCCQAPVRDQQQHRMLQAAERAWGRRLASGTMSIIREYVTRTATDLL